MNAQRINPDRQAATWVSALLAAFLAGKIDRFQLADKLNKAAAAMVGTQERPKRIEPTNSEDVIAVHAAWCSVMNQRCKLTPGRQKKIAARLKSFSLADVIKAVRGCATSEFHMGKNDGKTRHNDLELICRNDESVEKFLRMAAERGVSSGAPIDRQTEKLQREAERALTEGRLDDYDRINNQLAQHQPALAAAG